MGQPDTLQRKALDLKQYLKDLDIKRIIEQNKQDPDREFLEWYGEDPDDLLIWDKATEAKIKNLGYKLSDLISLAKNRKNSCFKERSYPTFSGKILDYYNFRTQWSM